MSKPENPFPGYKHLLIEPYTPSIGAVVHDFDLANIEDSDARGELRQALAEFQVLFFRKQKLSPAEQVAVARVFGDPDKAKAFFPRHEAQKFIEVLEARPGVNRYGTDQWHADITFAANPPTGTVLYSHIVPEAGGDTVSRDALTRRIGLPSDTAPNLLNATIYRLRRRIERATRSATAGPSSRAASRASRAASAAWTIARWASRSLNGLCR